MADTYRKPSPGDPLDISARLMGDVIELVTERHRARHDVQADTPDQTLDTDRVWVRNDSGGALDQYSVVGLDTVLNSDFPADLNQFLIGPVWSVVTPTVADHSAKFGILLSPLAADGVGLAVVSGVIPCQIYDPGFGPTGVQRCDVTDGNSAVLSIRADGSAQILYRKDGDGYQWGLVRIGRPVGPRYAKVTGRWSGSSFRAKLCDASGTETGDELQIYATAKLPTYGLDNIPRWPNVEIGNLLFVEAVDSYYFLASPEYWDEPPGTLRLGINMGTPPQGWAFGNGSDNSVANGGSGKNWMDDRFLRMSASAGDTGGSDTHTHTDHPATATSGPSATSSGGISGTVGSGTHTHNTPVLSHSTEDNIPRYATVEVWERLNNWDG